MENSKKKKYLKRVGSDPTREEIKRVGPGLIQDPLTTRIFRAGTDSLGRITDPTRMNGSFCHA